MTPTPPSTSSSVDGQSPNNNYRVVRKRNRVPLSCAPCRARKLKCNRTMPCEKCIKRNDAASCTFAPGRKQKSSSLGAVGGSPNSDEMQNRIDRLEGLVLSLVSNGGPANRNGIRAMSMSESADSSDYHHGNDDPNMIPEGDEDEDDEDVESDVDSVSKSMGMLKVMDKTQTQIYVGDSHWATVLKDITELKEHYNSHHVQQQYREQMTKVEEFQKQTGSFGPILFRGVGSVPSSEMLIASLPHRSVVDRLIARFFSGSDCASNLLHRPTFWRKYEKHFQDPSKAELSFVGLLYAIMTLSMQSYDRVGDAPPEYIGKEVGMADEYRVRTVQCLIASNYCQPTPNILLTLYFYLQGEYSRCRDTSFGLWMLVSTIVRIAMRMGYHRDVKNLPNVTPYEVEMRCRIWAAIYRADLLFSFQIGLPNMISSAHIDRLIPQNLNDEDFGEDSKKLPPARPMSEATQVSYFICITRLAHLFHTITEKVNAIDPCNFETVLRLDGDLQGEKTQIPPHLRMRPLSESERDPPTTIMERFNLDMLHYKARIVLHRRFMKHAQTNPRYAYSRDVCVESALKLLEYQSVLHIETKPGGRLQSAKWFLASLTTGDYLLAGVMLCLDMYYQAEAFRTGNNTYVYNEPRGKREVKACILAKAIWRESMEHSMEAYKAVSTLDVMTQRITQHCPDRMRRQLFGNAAANAMMRDMPTPPSQQGDGGSNIKGDADTSSTNIPAGFVDAGMNGAHQQPEQAAAMTLGMLSGGLSPNNNNNGSNIYSDRSFITTPGGVNMAMTDPSAMGAQFGSPGDFGSFFGNAGMLNDMPMNLDLEAFDSYLQSTNFDGLAQGFPGMDMTSSADPINFASPSSSNGGVSVSQMTPGTTGTSSAASRPDSMSPQHRQMSGSNNNNNNGSGAGLYGNGTGGGGVFMGVQSPPSGSQGTGI